MSSLYSQRPNVNRDVAYKQTPDYYHHKPYEDKLAILVCQIKIWKAKGTDWFNIPSAKDCLTIRECESIEVTDSAKELINKAVVRFARGTVISQTSKENAKVSSGNKEDSTNSSQPLNQATNNGEITTPSTSRYEDSGVSTTSMTVSYDDKGLINYNRSKKDPALLSPNDIAIGNRIEIRLGYAYSEAEFEKMNSTDNINNDSNMCIVFTGFITSISVSTPLELECTNMAHVFSCISAPNVVLKHRINLKEFFDDNGKYPLLKGTGISVAEFSKGATITVQGGVVTDNLTVADVLTEWNKSGVLCMMETQPDGSVKLKAGLAYYAGRNGGQLPNNDKRYVTYNGGITSIKIIQFDWDVAQDKLTMKHNDKKYLAVQAFGQIEDRFYKLTIRKNPDSDDEGWIVGEEDYQVVNKQEVKNRKKPKKFNGNTSTKRIESKLTDHVKLDKYTVITYISTTPKVTQKQLIEEAKQYWANYVPNGISGSIEIFGDLDVRPTDIIGLIDPRQPEKNGYYYVEAVNTSFGVNGYRKELHIPYKIASYAQQVKII